MIPREAGTLPAPGTPFPVTPAQAAVLDLAARGLCDKEIARALVCSHRTVRKHLEHVYTRSGQRGRTRVAVLWALAQARKRVRS